MSSAELVSHVPSVPQPKSNPAMLTPVYLTEPVDELGDVVPVPTGAADCVAEVALEATAVAGDESSEDMATGVEADEAGRGCHGEGVEACQAARGCPY